jgi:hypothetical protein
VFEIADHLDRAIELLEPEALAVALKVNLDAGAAAVERGDGRTAAEYLGAARSLCDANECRPSDADRTALYSQSAEAAMLIPRFDEAAGYFEKLRELPMGMVQRALTDSRAIYPHAIAGDLEGAAKTGVRALEAQGWQMDGHRAWLRTALGSFMTRRLVLRLTAERVRKGTANEPASLLERALVRVRRTLVRRDTVEKFHARRIGWHHGSRSATWSTRRARRSCTGSWRPR